MAHSKEGANEVENPKGVMPVSRESGCVRCREIPWGADGEVSVATEPEKRERGFAGC
jgi:hypothetical protein